MTNEQIEQVNQGVRQLGIAYLQGLAATDPAFFLDLIGYVLTDAEVQSAPPGHVQFIITQQPGSNNRT